MPFKQYKTGFCINAKISTKSYCNKIGNIITIDNKKYLKIFVTATPHKNQANNAVIELLTKELRLPKTHISIKTGKTSKSKIIYVQNIETHKLICKEEKLWQTIQNSLNNA